MKNHLKCSSILLTVLFLATILKAQTSCNGLTYSQGAWGAPNGNTATNYMTANFSSAFPNGLTIGCNNVLTLSTATDVIDFLPSGSTATNLPTGTLTDPGNSYDNVFAGQLVALVLSATFDANDPNFSPASVSLSNYYITSGTFSGMTVGNFITLCNSEIGGCSSLYSYSQLAAAAASINLNYDGGDNGFLSCCNVSASAASGNILCYGGMASVSITAIGGASPYQGTGVQNASAGITTFTVTDANGCSATTSVNLSEPALLICSAQNGNILCNGGSTSATITATGGTGAYTGTGVENVSSGLTTFTVSDANGCTAITSVNVSEPPALVASAVTGNILCHGGSTSATITATGGTGGYTGTGVESVSAGNSTFTVTDANGCAAYAPVSVSEPALLVPSVETGNILCHGGSTNATITATGGTGEYTGTGVEPVSAGNSTYAVVDANGCSASVTVAVTEPALLVASAASGNILCNGGSTTVSVTASGGTSPYSGTTTQNVTAGSYSYQVTDNNGCNAATSINVTQPDPLVMSAVKSDVTCYGGTASANATANGGTAPYNFVWNTTPSQNGASANLPVGNWNVSLTDANGCTNSVSGLNVILLSCTGFVTASQGGWGASCSGGNIGCYRNTNFASAFPNGITLGSGSKQLRLTSASAVDAFLPSTTTARALNNGTLTNPGTSYKNVLAGQAAALKLSIGFDAWSSSFAPSSSPLSGLIVSSGIFAGWSVSAILNEADNILGGGSSVFTALQVNDVLNDINANYDYNNNLGLLACACSGNRGVAGEESSSTEGGIEKMNEAVAQFNSFPNPFTQSSNIRFGLKKAGNITLNVYNYNGQLVQNLYTGSANANEEYNVVFDGANLKDGIYFVVLNTTDGSSVKKLVLTR